MEYIISGESYENREALLRAYVNMHLKPPLVLNSTIRRSREAISEFAVTKMFPSTTDYDLVMGLSPKVLKSLAKTNTFEKLQKAAFVWQRLSRITENMSGGRFILSCLLTEKYPNSIMAPSDIYGFYGNGFASLIDLALVWFTLNRLRAYTPIFLGILSVHSGAEWTKMNTSVISNGLILAESVLGNSLTKELKSINVSEFRSIFTLVLTGLELAYRLYGFKHNKLNTDSVSVYILKNDIHVQISHFQYSYLGDFIDEKYKDNKDISDVWFFLVHCYSVANIERNFEVKNEIVSIYNLLFSKEYSSQRSTIDLKLSLYTINDKNENFSGFLKKLNLKPLADKEEEEKVKVNYIFKPVVNENNYAFFLLRERYLEDLMRKCHFTPINKRFVTNDLAKSILNKMKVKEPFEIIGDRAMVDTSNYYLTYLSSLSEQDEELVETSKTLLINTRKYETTYTDKKNISLAKKGIVA